VRKKICTFVMAVVMAFSIGIQAAADTYKNGEVLYHQDFASLSSMPAGAAGIRKGTASSPDSVLMLDEEALQIVTNDDLRTYALLPEMPWTDSYTIEFDFRFCNTLSSRGYLAFLLTCWGDEPSNVTSLVIRADGTIDDFGALSNEMVKKLKTQQETFHVEIPIENGILYEVTLTAGDTECTVKRESLKRVSEGSRGFCVRNTSAAIDEVFVVNGTGYTAKSGVFADASWSDDPSNIPIEEAPPTGDMLWLLLCPGVAAGGMHWAKRTKKHS